MYYIRVRQDKNLCLSGILGTSLSGAGLALLMWAEVERVITSNITINNNNNNNTIWRYYSYIVESHNRWATTALFENK